MITTQKFNLDLSAPVGPLVLYAMQADSMSRFFAITVTDNGAAWTPPDGAAWTVRFGAPGMPAGWYDTITEPGGGTHPAVVVDENTATVEIAEQAVSTPGNNVLCVLVTDAQGYQIASWPFALNVQGVPGFDAPEATVYYNALTAQVAQVLANAQAAAASATLAESWAVGGTGTRPGEDTDNAEYWAEQAQQVSQGALGWYETEQALQAAHPTGENGQWAIIGTTDTIWTWDSDTSAWVNSGSTADLSNYYTKAQADAAFATAAQGALAASAVQSVNGKTGGAVTLTASDVGAAENSTPIVTAFGQFGAAASGTFELYGKILAVRFPGGLWRVDFTGQVETNSASGSYGISLTEIESQIGKSLNFTSPQRSSFLAFPASGSSIQTSVYGYSCGVNVLAGNILQPGRYYANDGQFGVWPIGSSANLDKVGTYWVATMYFVETE